MTPGQMTALIKRFSNPPAAHRSGEPLLGIVYADPGNHGFYYRERMGDSVAAYVRTDHVGTIIAHLSEDACKAAELTLALHNLANEMRHLLRVNPAKDGGLYRQRLNEADAILAVEP